MLRRKEIDRETREGGGGFSCARIRGLGKARQKRGGRSLRKRGDSPPRNGNGDSERGRESKKGNPIKNERGERVFIFNLGKEGGAGSEVREFFRKKSEVGNYEANPMEGAFLHGGVIEVIPLEEGRKGLIEIVTEDRLLVLRSGEGGGRTIRSRGGQQSA